MFCNFVEKQTVSLSYIIGMLYFWDVAHIMKWHNLFFLYHYFFLNIFNIDYVDVLLFNCPFILPIQM